MKNKSPKIVIIVGPTASGKSALGIKLARKFNGEIVSADSRQVYIGMDMGTGKVTKAEQKLAKHHLIDIVSPKSNFTIADFKKLGDKALRETLSMNKVPIIVGGTGFYIDALINDIFLPAVPPNKKLRGQLEKKSAESLYMKIKKLDPRRAKNIDPKNKRRLIRALEIVITTGKPVPKSASSPKYQVLWLGLRPKDLEKRIKLRLEKRLRGGMVKEVKKLLAQGVSKKRLFDFGLEYRWVSRYLTKEISYRESKEGLIRAIIQYSKRQMTWFKRNKEIKWVKDRKEAERITRAFLLSGLRES